MLVQSQQNSIPYRDRPPIGVLLTWDIRSGNQPVMHDEGSFFAIIRGMPVQRDDPIRHLSDLYPESWHCHPEHHLWNIDVLICRMLVYTILNVILALLYVCLVLVFGILLLIIASTLVITTLFQPLRLFLQRFIDRGVLSQKGRRAGRRPFPTLQSSSEEVADTLLPLKAVRPSSSWINLRSFRVRYL